MMGRINVGTHGLCVLLIIALLFLNCVREDEPETFALGVGDALPEFSVETLHGNVVDKASFAGKRGAVAFFTTTCPDCRRELPRLEAEYRNSEPDFELVCISRGDNAGAVEAFWEEYNLTMPVAADVSGAVYRLFASRGVPRLFIVDDGIITASYVEIFPEFGYLKKHS